MARKRSHTRWIIGAMLSVFAGGVLLEAAILGQSPPPKDAYTRGEIEFSVGSQRFQLPLAADSTLLIKFGKKFRLGLMYAGKRGQGLSSVTPNVRFLVDVEGPGKWDKDAIQNLVVQTDLSPWNFSRAKDDCVIELTRFSDTGDVAGSVTCTTAVPFTGMKFTAAP